MGNSRNGLGIGIVAAEPSCVHVESALREAETQHQLKQVEHELQIARSIQQSLLPKVRPQIPGFEVAGWSRSADDTGGDFYDWKRLPDGRWVMVLADVTRTRNRAGNAGLGVPCLFTCEL